MQNFGNHTRPGLVIVGIDGSDNSQRAFDVALSIAQQRQCELKLVAAFTEPSSVYMPADTYDVARQQTEHILDDYVSQAQDSSVNIASAAMEGDAAGVLISESDTADLVVVGKRGRSRFAGRFLGSVSAAVAAHAKCPSLIVPQQQEIEQLPETQFSVASSGPRWADIGSIASAHVHDTADFGGSVVVGLDLEAQPVETALQGADYAREQGLGLILVTAEPLSGGGRWGLASPAYAAAIPAMRSDIAAHLEAVADQVATKTSVPLEWRFYDTHPAEVLTEASHTAQLVVVGTRGRGGFAGLLLGSVSQEVLNRAVAPVLVVPTTHA